MSVDAPPEVDERTLTALDRRTGRQIPLVSPASPPPLLSSDPWYLAGFDVSPDGRSVAFGVVSVPSGRSSTAPPTTAAAIYLEPIDGSSAPKRIRVISGPRPVVWVERFSPDGRWLLGASETWTVWPIGAGAAIVSAVFSPYAASGIQWSPDGTRIAVGEHYERNSPEVTSMLRFDTAHRTLTRTQVNNDSTTIPGTAPWFGIDGALHVITDPPVICSGPQDIDSSFRWGLSAPNAGCSGSVSDLTWWNSTTGPQIAHPLHLALPQGVRQVAW